MLRRCGYILFACLFISSLALAAKVPSRGTVTASALNVRTGPGTSYGIVGVIHNGDAVDIIDISGSWFKVNAGSYTNKYVHSRYIDVTDYADITNDDASKKPFHTLYSTDPKRAEVGEPPDTRSIPSSDF